MGQPNFFVGIDNLKIVFKDWRLPNNISDNL